MKFDARAAKALAAGDHLTMDEQPGLRLVAREHGVRTWTYRYKSPVDGGMRQLKLGDWPKMSVAAAIVEWEKRKAERDSGRCPANERRTQRREEVVQATARRVERAKGRFTVRRLVDEFAAQVTRKPKGVAELKRLFATMLGPIETLLPAEVTRSVAYDLISSYSSTPVNATNLRRELGAAWDWGHDSGRLQETVPNWWRQVLRGKLASKGKIVKGKHQGSPVKRVLTVQEVGAILRFLPNLTRVNSDLLTLYLWTGTRGAETVAMRGDEVKEEADGWWWTIPKSKLKTGRHEMVTDLRVPLIGRALEIVRSRIDVYGGEYLFPSRPGSKLPHVAQKVIGVAVWTHMPDCKLRPEWERPRWPVANWAPHDLRRTVRTRLAAMGCERDVAEAIIGHVLPDDDQVYNQHQYDPERRAWLTKLIDVWEAAAVR